jgi:hypothetical protein
MTDHELQVLEGLLRERNASSEVIERLRQVARGPIVVRNNHGVVADRIVGPVAVGAGARAVQTKKAARPRPAPAAAPDLLLARASEIVRTASSPDDAVVTIGQMLKNGQP